MSTDPDQPDTDTDTDTGADTGAERDTAPRVPGVGDDERENREHIARTGEPARDKFGNADGAS